MFNKNEPLVSIVLPVYNGAEFLSESIDSCLWQTYKNWELIIVDDCSSDNTPLIIKNYVETDFRIKSIRNATNLKLPGSLNRGFSVASGTLFTWTSDDNLYREFAIQSLVNALMANENVGFVYSNFSNVTKNLKLINEYSVKDPEYLVLENCVGPSFLYRQSIARCVGDYDENLFLAEDYDYWLRFSQLSKMMALRENLYIYRIHDNSLTSQKKDKVVGAALNALKKNLPYMHWLSDPFKAYGYLRLVRKYKRRYGKQNKINWLSKSIKYSPNVVLKHFYSSTCRLFRKAFLYQF